LSLLGAAEIRQLAEKLDIRPTKKLGQNFVIDPNTIRKIIGKANLKADDVVVEIGPGLGSLTLGLFEEVQKVIAVEIDSRLADQLAETVDKHTADKTLEVINADALKVTDLDSPSALVANLPYNISVPVLLHFWKASQVSRKG
jgi:16S rRNA (adenine1518-N6/adenine1519-N6)-dimethyltransferase